MNESKVLGKKSLNKTATHIGHIEQRGLRWRASLVTPSVPWMHHALVYNYISVPTTHIFLNSSSYLPLVCSC